GRLRTWDSPSEAAAGSCRPPPARSLRQLRHFAACPRGQGRKHRVRVVAEEANRAVPHQEIAPARVEAPEVELVTLVADVAGLEMVRARWARRLPIGAIVA